ncbi:GMC oxidoreductase [Colletotrichum abscissum]|uniref:GMC oxidoreductase n=1 Tax=Colletotrichum abscissum TaxID=1671311 RepID=A0A9P9XR67_9PEZI|nr:GMC oxidoreductase [Colletotrichum abscissum]KAI3558458.1 GMC oxidoreductase [Colletotrichum abscissum]KAK1511643.1 GMC oxidoreductase [Colletotrichum abscissum]
MGSLPQEIIYDFIVCGGGTSGCVVASRLAENSGVNVLVIEAGEHNENLENVHMTGGWSQLFDKDTDWNVISEKKPSVNNRQVKLSRGKFLGGCSGCNGTLCIRGAKQDYDDWGVEGWTGDEVFKYIRKAENFHGKPWFEASKDHGTNGHLNIEPHDLAPISNLIMDSMVSKGLPLDHDMFSHGENPHGCGHAPRTVHKGLRTTAADFVTKENKKDNLHLLVETHVEKVIIEEVDGGLRATGVRVVKADGSVVDIKARKEVIVSGGAYCSPNILNRSGVGAKAELDSFGIPTLVDLPGVGKNLMDHLIVFMFYETEKAGLTNDHHVYHGDNFAKTYALWKDQQAGFLSTFPFGAFAYARLDERLADSELWNKAPRQPGRDPMGLTPKQPNIEFFTTECYGGPKQYDQFPTDGKYAFSMIAELFGPRSRGTVTLRDTGAKSVPVVDTNYLSDPLDVEVLAEACRFGNEIIMEGAGTKDIVKGSWPSDLVHHKHTTREDWIPYVRDNATTCYHAAGTCAMGNASDRNAVVDPTLTVMGVKGLRVADCSIMPVLNGGHTQMPAYGIGEKAADLIKASWKL